LSKRERAAALPDRRHLDSRLSARRSRQPPPAVVQAGRRDSHPDQHEGEHARGADPGVAPLETVRGDLDDPNARLRRATGRLVDAVVMPAKRRSASG